jgi:hypothetical protein|tara:strand:+ start:2322 stop:2669 length:348 start_codon:yes stop_codon:yes gene_type:complete
MNLKYIFSGSVLFILSQTIIWYQTNGQFFSPWIKERPIVMASLGFPISYILIYASKFAYEGFGDNLWPTRFVGFVSGMVIMALLTSIHLNEGINSKTVVSLSLCFIIVLIQLFWK